MTSGRILSASSDGLFFLKLVGAVTYRMSGDFNAFLEALFRTEAQPALVFDLTEASAVDSTILGLIAKAARLSAQQGARRPAIISSNPDITRLLVGMGFEQVFDIISSPQEHAGMLQDIPSVPVSDAEKAAAILDAHKHLVDLSAKNRAAFQDIVLALEKDLQRKRQRS